MSRKTAALIAGAVTVAVLVLVIRGRLRPEKDDEQQLLELIEQAAGAAERRDIKYLKARLSKSYKDSAGRGSREIGQLLTWQFLRGGTISVYLLDKEVQLAQDASPRAAEATVQAVITRRPRVKRLSDIVPDQARSLTFGLTFRKEEGEWLLTAAEWTDNPNLREMLR